MFWVSFLYSNLGLGGGMLYVPILLFVATSMDRLEIIPVSLFLVLMTQLPAWYAHHKKGLVKWKLGLQLALATTPGVVIGLVIGIRTTDTMTFSLFSILMFATGIKMLNDVYKRKLDNIDDSEEYTKQKLIAAFVISIGTGIVSSFFGVGGGIITVPVLIYVLGLHTRRAIGTSAMMILFTSSIGFVCYNLLAYDQLQLTGVGVRSVPPIQYELAVILGLVVLIGAYLGSAWGLRSLKTRNIQVIFIIIVFVVGIQLLLRALGYL
jgi:hypothetical protein